MYYLFDQFFFFICLLVYDASQLLLQLFFFIFCIYFLIIYSFFIHTFLGGLLYTNTLTFYFNIFHLSHI